VNNLGVKTPITPETVAQPLSVGLRDGDGIRVSLSEFVEGEPLGPFTYDGLRTTPTTSSATGIAVALVADRPDAERLAAASAFHRPRPQRLRTDHSGVLRQLAEAEATPPSPPTDPRHTTTDRSPAPLPRTPPP
jgi:hypothetical protein